MTATPRPTVAVTGSTGAVGSSVAARLSSAGVPLRLVVRDPARARALPSAEVRVAEYRDGAAMRRALDGVHTMFLVSARESADRLAEHLSAVDAAADAGVGRVVYLSILNAAPDATFTLARQHWATEQALREAGPAWTFLRDSLYADFLPAMVGAADRTIRGPAGDGRVAPVARDDVAEVAAAVLLAGARAGPSEHDGRTYDLTGPEAVTLAQVAGVLSRVTGIEVRYHAETPAEAYASRASYGAPDWEVAGWVTSYAAVAAGEMATVSPAVRDLTGHGATGLAELFERRPELWAHLR